ncbi:MAG: hypothetical protein H7Y03_08795 [Chitinophagaceae bacterium]|nr:hypothetical protein [Chitinophagaceae bacterium]
MENVKIKLARWIPLFILLSLTGIAGKTQKIPTGYDAKGILPVGYTDLEGKPAFKMSVKEYNGKWYLFTGHFWHSGWSVIDVTNPAKPTVARFMEGPPNTATFQMELHGNTMITALEKILPDFGGDTTRSFAEGIYIWDISNPLQPKRQGHFTTKGTGTHRNFYNGGKYVHLAAGMPGYKGNIYVIIDISNPSQPTEVSRWWVPGQKESETGPALQQDTPGDKKKEASLPLKDFMCGSDAEVSLHGPPYVIDSLVYLPYGSAGMIILNISDIRNPRQVARLDFSPPFHARFGVHSALPVPDKKFAFVNSEDVSYGEGPLAHASIVDITDVKDPKLMAIFPQPVHPSGKSYRQQKGWSGPHNFNHLLHNPDVQQQGDIFYMTWFNAGLRMYDVSDPHLPKEIGHFVPPHPRKRYGRMPKDELVVQTEDVVVDRRGYVYISDKNQGVYILKKE